MIKVGPGPLEIRGTLGELNICDAANLIGGMVDRADEHDFPRDCLIWCLGAAAWDYLINAQNSSGAYVFRDFLLRDGELSGIPIHRVERSAPYRAYGRQPFTISLMALGRAFRDSISPKSPAVRSRQSKARASRHRN